MGQKIKCERQDKAKYCQKGDAIHDGAPSSFVQFLVLPHYSFIESYYRSFIHIVLEDMFL